MTLTKTVKKRDFIQHASKYLKWVEQPGPHAQLIITHHNQPHLVITKMNSIKGLRGTVLIKEHGDINEPILPWI